LRAGKKMLMYAFVHSAFFAFPRLDLVSFRPSGSEKEFFLNRVETGF